MNFMGLKLFKYVMVSFKYGKKRHLTSVLFMVVRFDKKKAGLDRKVIGFTAEK